MVSLCWFLVVGVINAIEIVNIFRMLRVFGRDDVAISPLDGGGAVAAAGGKDITVRGDKMDKNLVKFSRKLFIYLIMQV